ncbi:hypothetical protein [Glycomyces sp. NPDC048151]|uniref:hypothetical protein n=1 Tax=Glycomyces sp. NPDC048151 TaxID=3364002 RepID=UPI0037182F87
MTPERDDLPRRRPGLAAYRTREDAYARPRPLRLGDSEMRVLNDRITALARPSASRSDPRTGLPNRAPVRALSEPGLQPGPGEGVLSVLADGGGAAPVVSVDGVPVSVGDGQLDLVLLAGTHRVEVQSTYTVDPVDIAITDGGTYTLQFFEDPATGRAVFGELPETRDFIPTSAGCWSWLALTSLICCLPMSGAMIGLPSEDWHLPSGVALGVLAVVLIVTGLPLYRRAKAKYHRDLATQRQAAPREPVPHGTDAIHLGAKPTALPPLPEGTAAIDLRLTCGRHLWAGHRKAAHGSFLARAWTRPPRVYINGTERPASWGHWRYLVPTGAYQVTVAIDGRPLNLDIPARHTGNPEKQRDLRIEAHAGRATAVHAEAHVYAVWRPATGDIESYEPRLWLEPA